MVFVIIKIIGVLKLLDNNELWEKCATNKPITYEDIGLPPWRKDCDGLIHILGSVFCKSGIAYKHKDGYRWANGDFLTKKQLKVYGL